MMTLMRLRIALWYEIEMAPETTVFSAFTLWCEITFPDLLLQTPMTLPFDVKSHSQIFVYKFRSLRQRTPDFYRASSQLMLFPNCPLSRSPDTNIFGGLVMTLQFSIPTPTLTLKHALFFASASEIARMGLITIYQPESWRCRGMLARRVPHDSTNLGESRERVALLNRQGAKQNSTETTNHQTFDRPLVTSITQKFSWQHSP